MLDSIRAPAARPAGPLFTREEILGRWRYESGGTGGSFVDARSGGSLGTAVRGASGELLLGEDGRYEDGFSMFAYNPGAGTAIAPQAQGHAGRFDFAGDVIVMQPDKANGLDNRRKVAGVGSWASPNGPRRVLILLNPEGREFKPLAWVPVWDGHAGVMRWYREAG